MSAEQEETPSSPPSGATHDGPRLEEGEEAAPPGVRTMAIVRWAILAWMAAAAVGSIVSYALPMLAQSTATAPTKKPRYRCPMHPQIVSDLPGECPICHMTLEPIPDESAMPPAPSSSTSAPPARVHGASPGASTSPEAKVYACPMHPQIQSNKPGTCPLCGMELEPLAAPNAPTSKTPAGTMPITVTLDRAQAIGVRTALVERARGAEALRITAAVEVPEQRRAEVHARAAGFVEQIYVRDIGAKVKAGETLAGIYIPEVYQAEQELLAIKTWSGAAGDASKGALEASKKRLDLLGFGDASVKRILASGQAERTTPLSSPIAGWVVKKNVVLGSRAMPEVALFEIADLSRVYVVGSVYADQLASLRVGAPATFTTPSVANRVFATSVELVYPDLDVATRTTRVRFQVDNKDAALLPGQFGVIELPGVAVSDALTVPLDAVVDTGREQYVFVDEGGGRFTPVSVVVGQQAGSRVAVRGLDEGQRVVSGATFLIDSESRLQASLARTTTPVDGGAASPPASPCDALIDRAKYPDKWTECQKCETVHRGMGSMVEDCRKAIPAPWK